jgi:hypothetical protein
MANEKAAELIKVILEKSRAGEVTWKKTSSKRTFLASFPKYSVTIEGPDFSPTFRLHTETGETIEEINILGVSGATKGEMGELFQLARRQSLGGEQAVDELLKILEASREKK